MERSEAGQIVAHIEMWKQKLEELDGVHQDRVVAAMDAGFLRVGADGFLEGTFPMLSGHQKLRLRDLLHRGRRIYKGGHENIKDAPYWVQHLIHNGIMSEMMKMVEEMHRMNHFETMMDLFAYNLPDIEDEVVTLQEAA